MTRQGNGFVGLTLRRPVSVLMVLTAALAVASLAFTYMPIELIPDELISSRNLYISVGYSGASPREIEEEILKPIEEALGTVPDIQQIRATASENRGRVRVRFTNRADLDLAYIEVRDRLERIKDRFPDQADRYRLRRFGGTSDIPVIFIGINFDKDIREVSPLVDQIIRRKLEQVDGVASARIEGLAAEEVRIEIDSDSARANQVDLYPLVQRLRGENVSDVSGGWVHEGSRKYYVRSLSRFQSLDEIRNFPVKPGLTLGEIATVKKAYAIERYVFRALGKPAVGITIYKESAANTASVCDRVLRSLDEDIKTDPRLGGLAFKIFWNQATWIRGSLHQLRDTATYGAIFALIILYLFLRRKRMTLLITAAIPISAMTALGVLYFCGKTINMLSLVGFTLAVGMLVDNSVVVVENIVRRRNEGEDPRTAARLGARQVGLAIFMSTLTTMVVFLPFLFMAESGPDRNILLEIVLPLVFSLTASLGVSLGLIPLTTLTLIKPMRPGKAPRKPGWSIRAGHRATGAYQKILSLALEHRFKVLLMGLLFILSGQAACRGVNRSSGGMGHQSSYRIHLIFPKKFTLLEASTVVRDYESFFLERMETLKLEFVYAEFTRTFGSVNLVLERVPGYSPKDLARKVEGQLPVHPGVEQHIRFEGQDEEKDERTTFSVNIFGPDSRILTELAEDMKPLLEKVPGVIEVVTAEERGFDEIHLQVDRTRAGKYQVDPRAVRGSVVYALQGARLLDFEEDEHEIPMVMRFSEEETDGLEAFEKFLVYSRTGEEIPLEALAKYSFRKGYQRITRIDRRTLYPIVVRVADPDRIWAANLRTRQVLKNFTFPQGYSGELSGSVSTVDTEMETMAIMGLLGLFFIYLVMGVLFESFVLPLTIILVTIPTAVVGGFWTLAITGTPVDAIGVLGFFILVGIAVNNGIVLVDYFNRLRALGRPRREAVMESARHRFRPILMTALTTIGGLTPMALSPSPHEGFDYLPMSRIVVGGLVAATLFSLILVPVTYTVLDDLRTWAKAAAQGLFSSLSRGPAPSDSRTI